MEIKWDDIAIKRNYALFPSNLEGTIEDRVLVGFNLPNRMDRSTLSAVCVLTEDGNSGSSLGDDLGRSITYRQSLQLVVINACDCNSASVASKGSSVSSYDATVGSPVN